MLVCSIFYFFIFLVDFGCLQNLVKHEVVDILLLINVWILFIIERAFHNIEEVAIVTISLKKTFHSDNKNRLAVFSIVICTVLHLLKVQMVNIYARNH